jgi:hypothetical protein
MSDTPHSNSEKQARYRARLRAQGLRPVQIWVPDTRAPGFAKECARQARAMAKADRNDPGLAAFLTEAASFWLSDEDDEKR